MRNRNKPWKFLLPTADFVHFSLWFLLLAGAAYLCFRDVWSLPALAHLSSSVEVVAASLILLILTGTFIFPVLIGCFYALWREPIFRVYGETCHFLVHCEAQQGKLIGPLRGLHDKVLLFHCEMMQGMPPQSFSLQPRRDSVPDITVQLIGIGQENQQVVATSNSIERPSHEEPSWGLWTTELPAVQEFPRYVLSITVDKPVDLKVRLAVGLRLSRNLGSFREVSIREARLDMEI